MGFDADGRITGMHCRVLADAGAYAGFGGALALGPTRTMAQGVYAIPVIRYDVAVALTNTTPMGAFRVRAGRKRPNSSSGSWTLPPASSGSTRSSCAAATCCRPSRVLHDRDGHDLRRRRLREPLEEAIRLAGYEQLRAEQAARRASGDRWQLGIGVGVYVEVTAGGGPSSAPSRCTRTARRPSGWARRGTGRAMRRRSP